MTLSDPSLDVKSMAGSGRVFINIYMSGRKESEGCWLGRREGEKEGGKKGGKERVQARRG